MGIFSTSHIFGDPPIDTISTAIPLASIRFFAVSKKWFTFFCCEIGGYVIKPPNFNPGMFSIVLARKHASSGVTTPHLSAPVSHSTSTLRGFSASLNVFESSFRQTTLSATTERWHFSESLKSPCNLASP